MTRFLLIRHAQTASAGIKLTGRLPEIPLTAEGRSQSECLIARLSGLKIQALYSSPLERALQTASFLAHDRGLPVQAADAFTEVDFGDWTGREIQSLESDPLFRGFQEDRESARIPGGESMTEVQARAAGEIQALAGRHPDATVAIVSHADVLRAALCRFLGLSLNHMLNFQLDPCSLSVLDLYPDTARITLLNSTGQLLRS
jgi:broad specificity phosphatase PhoE